MSINYIFSTIQSTDSPNRSTTRSSRASKTVGYKSGSRSKSTRTILPSVTNRTSKSILWQKSCNKSR